MTESIKENFLSIIIPVYNGERYIAQCLNSIFNSTIPDSMEVIVVDDGSKDNTKNIVHKYLIDNELILGGVNY